MHPAEPWMGFPCPNPHFSPFRINLSVRRASIFNATVDKYYFPCKFWNICRTPALWCSKETLFVCYDARRTASKKSPSNSMRKMRLQERWCEHTVDLCPERRLLLQSTLLWRGRDEYDAAEVREACMLLLLLREHSRDAGALQQSSLQQILERDVCWCRVTYECCFCWLVQLDLKFTIDVYFENLPHNG